MIEWGPQPYEGIISVICEAFHISPAEAERQEWPLVEAVLDYRSAEQAKDIFNGKDKKLAFDLLTKNPHLLRILSRMNRAQRGLPLDGGHNIAKEGIDVAAAHRGVKDEEQEE